MQVFRGIHKASGLAVAMKFIAKAGKSPKDIMDIKNEIYILTCLNHPSIVELLDHFETSEDYCLVTELAIGQHDAPRLSCRNLEEPKRVLEKSLHTSPSIAYHQVQVAANLETDCKQSELLWALCPRDEQELEFKFPVSGDLHNTMATGKAFPEELVCDIGRQMISALAYVHQENFIHRDVKPANILLLINGNVKLCDFGLAMRLPQDGCVRGSDRGTFNYAAPEVVFSHAYGVAVSLSISLLFPCMPQHNAGSFLVPRLPVCLRETRA